LAAAEVVLVIMQQQVMVELQVLVPCCPVVVVTGQTEIIVTVAATAGLARVAKLIHTVGQAQAMQIAEVIVRQATAALDILAARAANIDLAHQVILVQRQDLAQVAALAKLADLAPVPLAVFVLFMRFIKDR
jgi:hypothetical protein